MIVLGIETSCDETGVALYHAEKGLLGQQLFSQVEMHADYGGVVPELASRDHVRKTVPLIKALLAECSLTLKDIDGVAYTAGPGLIGALLVGASVGRSLAYGLGVPAIAVHHMEGHLMSPMLEDKKPSYPFLALLISGGHTQLIHVKAFGEYHLLGETVDDAIGEAFDKTAKLLGLGYPGGPALSKLAETGDGSRFTFPRPMTDRPGLDFSFSGLKTFTLRTYEKHHEEPNIKANIARAFQDAVVDTLRIKCKRALEQTGLTQLLVAGGVSANHAIRDALTTLMEAHDGHVYFPRHAFCTDNGAMIAYVGCQRLLRGETTPLVIEGKPRWVL